MKFGRGGSWVLIGLTVTLLGLMAAGCGGSSGSGGGSSKPFSAHTEHSAPAASSTTNASAGSEGEDDSAAASTVCPNSEVLEADLSQPTTWKLRELGRAEGIKAFGAGQVKSGYRKFCGYASSNHTFLTLVFASYPSAEAKRHFIDQQEDERECREPSICTSDADPHEYVEDPQSYLAWAISPPLPGEPPDPWSYLAEAAGAAHVEGEGLLCELPLNLPERLGGESQAETESVLTGLHQFLREACDLPAEEEPGSGEPTPEAPEQVSKLAGTTDDEAGAEQTSVAYNVAVFEGDYETICGLTARNYIEQLDEPCPAAMAKAYSKLEPTLLGKNVGEVEEKARQFVSLLIANHSLVWDGSEWLDNPEGGREGYVEEE